MKKNELEGLTKDQLRSRAETLEHEIETLRNVIEASNTTVFDLLISEVKKEMQDNIAEEEWKKLKENQKKIEAYRSIEKTLQNQEDLLERKQEELEDVQSAIENYQLTLFEQGEIVETEFKDGQQQPLRTGDVYKKTSEDAVYYLIKKSSEKEGSFAIISNFFEGERLLQYPKNLELLNCSHYEGNIYIQDEDQEKALAGLRIIADSQEKETSDETSSGDEG